MARRCAVVMRGTSTPCVVDCISKMEDGLGVVVPIPTLFCAWESSASNRKRMTKKIAAKEVGSEDEGRKILDR